MYLQKLFRALLQILMVSLFAFFWNVTLAQSQENEKLKPPKTVTGVMQARPGGPMEEIEVDVHEVPVDPPLVSVDQAPLEDKDLVLGIVKDGQAVAYPVRFLAMSEIVDSEVGNTPVAPTW